MNITDEMLTAYLDGELPGREAQAISDELQRDKDLRERLERLDVDRGAMSADYGALAGQAPLDELSMWLKSVPDVAYADQSTAATSGQPARGRVAELLATAAACIVATIMLTSAVSWYGNANKPWREAVAEYQVLYAAETLAWNTVPAPEVETTLDRPSQVAGVALARDTLKLDQAQFSRGQMLKFNGIPLVQLAYLHKGTTPLAFCLTRDQAADHAPELEVREGLPLVHWARDGVSYMIIGKLPEGELMQMATVLQTRF